MSLLKQSIDDSCGGLPDSPTQTTVKDINCVRLSKYFIKKHIKNLLILKNNIVIDSIESFTEVGMIHLLAR